MLFNRHRVISPDISRYIRESTNKYLEKLSNKSKTNKKQNEIFSKEYDILADKINDSKKPIHVNTSMFLFGLFSFFLGYKFSKLIN